MSCPDNHNSKPLAIVSVPAILASSVSYAFCCPHPPDPHPPMRSVLMRARVQFRSAAASSIESLPIIIPTCAVFRGRAKNFTWRLGPLVILCGDRAPLS
ncbi:hypothetical protein BCR44DRAFT_34315 [Catenaria anguillulae PL171]|uniref:Uncharacterized protein n=1 Tax=Catenaria anguillulae PL171 TaxID=765915 RepID=A0A1Y2HKV0_9FUNG|nr:hypothetical protein BCR44DRAFT_34315 [Catenaria anguillulae PL171]